MLDDPSRFPPEVNNAYNYNQINTYDTNSPFPAAQDYKICQEAVVSIAIPAKNSYDMKENKYSTEVLLDENRT
jgi:hypothetical protein